MSFGFFKVFKKILFFLLIFYVLVLVQTSFFTHFNIFGQVPNLILIALFLIIIFDRGISGFFPFEAILAGLFLDIFSYRFLGVSIFLLCLASIFSQEILKVVKEHSFIILCVLFIAFVLFYESGILLFDYFFNQIDFSGAAKAILIKVSYNLFFSSLILCLILKFPNALEAKK